MPFFEWWSTPKYTADDVSFRSNPWDETDDERIMYKDAYKQALAKIDDLEKELARNQMDLLRFEGDVSLALEEAAMYRKQLQRIKDVIYGSETTEEA